MSTINDKSIVEKQYENTKNLNTRISIHDKYSVNKQGFGNWLASHYQITEGMRVLELGCGTGDTWKSHGGLVNKCAELVLTDISEGMIEAARNNLKGFDNITYRVVDIQDIPFASNSFNIVIANMMLYHVPDLSKGLAEVKRVLRNGGRFHCATYGENGIIKYIAELLKPYGATDTTNKNFTLQNGRQILSQYFSEIDMREYIDSLAVTNVDDMVDYLASLTGMTSISGIDRATVKSVLEKHTVDGVLSVPKEYGTFICR